MLRWIRAQGDAALIVNGGDIYPDGKTADFDAFWHQADEDVTLMCETPGNHDWRNAADVPGAGRIPHGYETFWSADARKSKQPIDSPKKGAARYEHFIDMDGWRLLFLDTGDYNRNPWPGRDEARADWLTSNLKPGRSNIILAHHSRIGRAGPHGDNNRLDRLWKTLFDASGAPRAVFTLAGHNHNVCIYGPKSKDDPEGKSVSFARGIYVFVNGAGGRGHYRDWFLAPGTRPDIYFDDDNFCATRINLIDAGSIDIDLLSFGTSGTTPPVPVQEASVKIRSSLS
jgi:hypothetical protein